MPKVTEDLQVPLPSAVAEELGVRPGDEVEWVRTESGMWLLPLRVKTLPEAQERIRLFNEILKRQREREAKDPPMAEEPDRGWTREDLYRRGRAD